jgi:uncharacterized membrane protein
MQSVKSIAASLGMPNKLLLYLAVGLLLIGWLMYTPPGLLGKADAVGYAVCHRIDVRSFHLGVRQLPLCARCSGMYLGAMLGLAFQAVVGRRRGGMPGAGVWVILGMLVVAFGVDGLNSFVHLFPGAPSLYEPSNWLRLLTGTGMGLVVAALVFPAFNQTVWKDWDNTPALKGLRSLVTMFCLAICMDLIVLTENPLILYPLALISVIGVLVLLTMVYTMLWLMVLRAENRFQWLWQLVTPLAGGFGTALMQIILLDVARYMFTGTWEGFHLG